MGQEVLSLSIEVYRKQIRVKQWYIYILTRKYVCIQKLDILNILNYQRKAQTDDGLTTIFISSYSFFNAIKCMFETPQKRTPQL